MVTALKGRGDIHSPANFTPESYEFVGAFDNAPADVWEYDADGHLICLGAGQLSDRAAALLLLVTSSPTAHYANGYRCDHCGAHIRYVGVFRHIPTGDHIAVGSDCTENRFPLSNAEFKRLQKEAADARSAQKIKLAWEAFKGENADVDWAFLYRLDRNWFIRDVLHKGRAYGNLSEAQVAAIVKSGERDIEWAWDAAIREDSADTIVSLPVPEGKGIVITGKLVSRKWKESQWGSVEKCLIVVTTDEGEYKVWGSVPKDLYDLFDKGEVVRPGAEVGDVVTFTANVERSDDDESFGFYSRPRKASVVTRGKEEG